MQKLPTALPDLFLGTLGPADAKAFYDLLQKNRAHLTALGDFLNEVSAPLEKWPLNSRQTPRRAGVLAFFTSNGLSAAWT